MAASVPLQGVMPGKALVAVLANKKLQFCICTMTSARLFGSPETRRLTALLMPLHKLERSEQSSGQG